MNYPVIVLTVYLIIMNLVSFFMYYADKKKAQKRRWRIPESTLLASAFAGGSLGAYTAMKIFRHKTKHPKFYISIPLMLIFHIIVFVIIFKKINN